MKGKIFVCRFCVLVFEDAEELSRHVSANHAVEVQRELGGDR